MKNLPAGQPAPSPPGRDDSGEPVNYSLAIASLPTRERVPWRPAVTGAASLGTPVGIGILNSLLGEVIAITEILVVLTVITVALFAARP